MTSLLLDCAAATQPAAPKPLARFWKMLYRCIMSPRFIRSVRLVLSRHRVFVHIPADGFAEVRLRPDIAERLGVLHTELLAQGAEIIHDEMLHILKIGRFVIVA